MQAGRILVTALLAALLQASAWGAKEGKLELRGKINYGAARFRFLRVTIFNMESHFTSATLTDPGGEFRFRDLSPGSYSLAITRRGLGEIRRSVVVTPGLADQKGVVRIDIPFSPADAALSRTAGLISKQQLAVPDKARNRYLEAEHRLAKRDLPGAIRLLEEALTIAPKYMAAWNYLGVLSYQSRDYAQAQEYFQKALEIEPNAYEPTVNLGGVLLALRQPQEALAYNLKAVEARPREALGISSPPNVWIRPTSPNLRSTWRTFTSGAETVPRQCASCRIFWPGVRMDHRPMTSAGGSGACRIVNPSRAIPRRNGARNSRRSPRRRRLVRLRTWLRRFCR